MSSTTDPPRARVSTDSAGSAPALRKSLDDDEEKQQQHGDEQAERRGARPEGDDDAPGAAAAAAAAGDDDAGSGAAARQPRWAEAQAGEELQAEESFACEDELETASRARAPAEGASEPAAAASTASAADMATTVVDDKESEEREGGTERAPRARARTKRTPSLLSPFEASQTRIWGVCLVGFDHALGPTVEWAHPPELRTNVDVSRELPFLALPDGAHMRTEDYSYFHMLIPTLARSTIFGISCNRQIQSEQLLVRGKDVTRSTVQKALVVLASRPIFGPLRDKLGVITRAFFAQKDFTDTSLLTDLYGSLVNPATDGAVGSDEETDEAGGMYMGTSLREFVHRFRFRTLMLVKLLMLQRKVMFFSAHAPVEALCTYQYSLVALIPSLLTNLEDAVSPELDERAQNAKPPTSLRTSDKQSLIRFVGLPLNIFGKDAFFQPYMPLQQIDLLKTGSYLVGTTNSIFQQQRDCKIDALVNIENASIDILDPALQPLLTLTAADRKWMDEIVTTVDSSWNAADPSRPLNMNFIGSDDFIRAKFEEYICSLLSCIKYSAYLDGARASGAGMGMSDSGANLRAAFNESFIRAFGQTGAFKLWDKTTDSVIFDLVEPQHPMEGKTNPIEDVGIRLTAGLHDLKLDENLARLDENLAPAREAVSRGISTGWASLASFRQEVSRRQQLFRERHHHQQQQQQQQHTAGLQQRDDKEPRHGSSATEKGDGAGESSAQPTSGPDIATTVLAGVDTARTQAATFASGLGGFIAAKRAQFMEQQQQQRAAAAAASSGSASSQGAAVAGAEVSASSYPSAPTSNTAQQQQQQSGGGSSPFASFFRSVSATATSSSSAAAPSTSTSTTTRVQPRTAAAPDQAAVATMAATQTASPAASPPLSAGPGAGGFLSTLRRSFSNNSAAAVPSTAGGSGGVADGIRPGSPSAASQTGHDALPYSFDPELGPVRNLDEEYATSSSARSSSVVVVPPPPPPHRASAGGNSSKGSSVRRLSVAESINGDERAYESLPIAAGAAAETAVESPPLARRSLERSESDDDDDDDDEEDENEGRGQGARGRKQHEKDKRSVGSMRDVAL